MRTVPLCGHRSNTASTARGSTSVVRRATVPRRGGEVRRLGSSIYPQRALALCVSSGTMTSADVTRLPKFDETKPLCANVT